MPKVTTVSKKEEAVADAPATVYVVTAKDIRIRGYHHLKDVLRDLPGMETIENYYAEVGTLVPVRGIIGNNKIVVLVNGVRINPPGGEAMMFRSDLSVRNAKQIEISDGPSSTLYGHDAISAIINIITKSPQKDKPFIELGGNGGINMSGPTPIYNGWFSAGTRLGESSEVMAFFQYYGSNLTDLSSAYPEIW